MEGVPSVCGKEEEDTEHSEYGCAKQRSSVKQVLEKWTRANQPRRVAAIAERDEGRSHCDDCQCQSEMDLPQRQNIDNNHKKNINIKSVVRKIERRLTLLASAKAPKE